MLFSRIDKVFAWARSSKTFSQNIFRGLVVLIMLFLILFTLSVYGSILLLVPRISTCLILGLLSLLFGTICFACLKEVKQTVWERVSFCAGFLFITFFSLFASGFIFGFIPASAGSYIFPEKLELPLGNTDGMAVDGHGHIYLTVPFYQRIQVYDSNGDFLKGLHVDTHGGAFYIWIENELLHVAISRTDKHIAMDLNGQILEDFEVESFKKWESLWKKASVNRYKDESGNVYQFQDSKWSPKVTKTEPSGNSTALISNPFHRWFLKAPFPAWMFGLFSMMVVFIIKLVKIGTKQVRYLAGDSSSKSDVVKQE